MITAEAVPVPLPRQRVVAAQRPLTTTLPRPWAPSWSGISRICRPGRASATWPPSSTAVPKNASDTRSPTTCAPSSSSTHFAWPHATTRWHPRRYFTATAARNTEAKRSPKPPPGSISSLNYYGAFYRSMLYSLAARIDEHLVRWALQKFKRLRGRPTRAWRWLDTVRRRQPTLFAHWYLLPSTPRRTVGAV